ncbi:choice-of-anchor A family protein [Streptomyces sp. NPDC058579]|uniref:choice-of-anchor A family protein n=1 Tax=Streptomyces sp. NPDC058579 TaxID=3346548 RepID=UPI00364F1D1C
MASAFAEFIEGSSRRVADTEGAVAIGGEATLGDPARKEGFSLGSQLGESDLNSLPGGYSLVVGGKLKAHQVVIERGMAVYRALEEVPGGSFAINGPHMAGASPVDFGKEFSTLRSRSAAWGALTPNGTVEERAPGEPATFFFEGDQKVNIFKVSASTLEKARTIKIKVPAGATTLITVTGTTYDMNRHATYGVHLWDHTAGRYVLDDYQAGSPAFKDVRSKLLWNFPQATEVQKNYASWPGTILAPRAAASLGRKSATGEVGPGHVNGSVIARSMTSVSGAETHHMPFRGCLPSEGEEPPNPTDPPTDPPVNPAPSEPGKPTPGTSTPPPGKTSPTPTPQLVRGEGPTPSASPAPEGDLASTGSDSLALYAGIALVLVAAGTLTVVRAMKRRGQSG